MNKQIEKATPVDTETGEILYPSQYNAETGEYEGLLALPHKTTFRIPPKKKTDEKIRSTTVPHNNHLEIITAVLFLLPAAIVSYRMITLLMLLEMIIHNWAHMKNKTSQSNTFYYKSPLHGIAKEFCGRCKESNAKEKISKLQDTRNDKMKKYGLESIRRVVT